MFFVYNIITINCINMWHQIMSMLIGFLAIFLILIKNKISVHRRYLMGSSLSRKRSYAPRNSNPKLLNPLSNIGERFTYHYNIIKIRCILLKCYTSLRITLEIVTYCSNYFNHIDRLWPLVVYQPNLLCVPACRISDNSDSFNNND